MCSNYHFLDEIIQNCDDNTYAPAVTPTLELVSARVLQCIVVCCSVLHCVAVCFSVLQCVAVCCSVLLGVAECCRVLQSVAVRHALTLDLVSARVLCLYSPALSHINESC